MNSKVVYKERKSDDEEFYLYTDASSDPDIKVSTIGLIIPNNWKDEYKLQLSKSVVFNPNIAVIEAKAIYEGLLWALKACITRIICHTDNECVFNILLTPVGGECKDLKHEARCIRKLCRKFVEVTIILVDRYQVEEPHKLAINKLREIRNNAVS